MGYVPLIRKYIMSKDRINEYVASLGGFLINYATCENDNQFVVRINPSFVPYITNYVQNLGFIVGNVNVSGIQTYIHIRGCMF